MSAVIGMCTGTALVASSYVLSIPIFFETFFMLLVPIARALRVRTGRDYMLFVLAICCGGTVTHSLIAPHPGPLAMAENLHLDLGHITGTGMACELHADAVLLRPEVGGPFGLRRPRAEQGGHGHRGPVAGRGPVLDPAVPPRAGLAPARPGLAIRSGPPASQSTPSPSSSPLSRNQSMAGAAPTPTTTTSAGSTRPSASPTPLTRSTPCTPVTATPQCSPTPLRSCRAPTWRPISTFSPSRMTGIWPCASTCEYVSNSDSLLSIHGRC